MFKIGSVVLVQKGHGIGKCFTVVGFEGSRLLLADGRRRQTQKPKKKNTAHVSLVGMTLSGEVLCSNKKLRSALHEYNF